MNPIRILCFTGGLLVAISANATRYYVSPTGTGTGTSWAKAMSIEAAFKKTGSNEFWLKRGTYNLTDTLTHSGAISVYGGFEGNETSIAARPGGDVRSILVGCDKDETSCVKSTLNNRKSTVVFDSIAFRHGWEHGLNKTGLSNVQLINCEFSGNGWGPTGSTATFIKGRGASIVSTARSVTLTVSGCVFSNNVDKTVNTLQSSVGGGGLYVEKYSKVYVSDTDFIGNGIDRSTTIQGPGRDNQSYGGGLYVVDSVLYADNCLFVGNRMTSNGTGDGGAAIGLRESSVNKSINGSTFSHCRIVANETCPYSATSEGYGGAVYISSYSDGNGSKVNFDFCTIAYNLAPRGKSAGVVTRNATVTVRNSIVYGNIAEHTICEGCDLYALSGSLTVQYAQLGGTAAPYVKAVNDALTLSDAETGDPLFASTTAEMAARMSTPSYTPSNKDNTSNLLYYQNTANVLATSVDVHLRSVKGRYKGGSWVLDDEVSPALDKADPSEDYSKEPTPNGDRANLGAYGATEQASKNKFGVPVITSATVSFLSDDYTRPHLSMKLEDAEDPYIAKVYFCYGLEKPAGSGIEDWFRVAEIAKTAHPGDEFTNVSGGVFMPASVKIYWRVVVQTDKSTVTQDGEAMTPETTPPQWGRGGDESVIHVWDGAQGTCGGTNWLDACMTLAQAVELVTETRTNIWVAGTVPTGSKTCEVNAPVTLLGGFTAVENSAAERSADLKTVLDGEQSNSGIIINPTLKTAEYVSARSMVADLVFTNMYSSALRFSTRSLGTVQGCEFVCCGWCESENLGAAIRVNASASDTEVTISNCVFRNCYKGISGGTDGYQGKFSVVSLESAKAVEVTACEFDNCGVLRTFEWNEARGRDTHDAFGLRLAVPTRFDHCRFAGNVFTTHNDDSSLIRFLGGSAGTTFHACEFSGNQGQNYSNGGAASGVEPSLFYVGANSADDVFSFDACTFAYNCIESCRAPIFNMYRGTVSVANSIFWGNSGIVAQSKGGVLSASVANFRATTARLALNYCLTDDSLPVAYFASGTSSSQLSSDNLVTGDAYFMTSTTNVSEHVRLTYSSGPQSRYFFTNTAEVAGLDAAAEFTSSINVHLRSREGYTDPQTGELVKEREISPAIDAGDPLADWTNEPKPNGKRLNLGIWGNTPWATRSFGGRGLVFVLNQESIDEE